MRKQLGFFALTAVSAFALGAGAVAQENAESTAAVDEDATVTLDTITVSARQRDETLLDVPFAVSATDRETLQRDQVVDLKRFITNNPGT